MTTAKPTVAVDERGARSGSADDRTDQFRAVVVEDHWFPWARVTACQAAAVATAAGMMIEWETLTFTRAQLLQLATEVNG